jgi:hypothetical protein
MSEKNFFEKFGLEVQSTGSTEIEVGKQYPIYGMITEFIDESPDNLVVQINFSIVAKIRLQDDYEAKLNLLKEKAFEPGIFISTILEKEDTMKVHVETVVFGSTPTQEVV